MHLKFGGVNTVNHSGETWINFGYSLVHGLLARRDVRDEVQQEVRYEVRHSVGKTTNEF